jgi:uncharacterized protein YjiK
MDGKSRPGTLRGILITISIFLLSAATARVVLAASSYHRVVRVIETPSFAVPHPAGLTYVTDGGIFVYLSMAGTGGPVGETLLMQVGFADDPLGATSLSLSLSNPLNIAYNPLPKKLLLFDDLNNELFEYSLNSDSNMFLSSLQQRVAVGHFGLAGAAGITVDPATGDLFVLDLDGRFILRVRPGAGQVLHGAESYLNAELSLIALRGAPSSGLRGLAFNPADGHLYVLHPGSRSLFEYSMKGRPLSVRDLSGVPMQDPRGMVFAPSGDRTDDPKNTSLYLADSGLPDTRRPGQIIEISLTEPVIAAASVQSSLIRTIDTSLFNPPSPDPAGLAWQTFGSRFFFSDSEVNEMKIFTGDNLFEMTTGGSLYDSMSTLDYSNEPTGLTFNTANGHLFVSDDNARRINEVDPGGDGLFGTPDDQVTHFDTRTFASDDPEGVAFDSFTQTLFIVDGVNSEVYILRPGGNGVFDGVPPDGDDQLSQFDTAGLGMADPEGIEFNDASGHLYLVGNGDRGLLAEVSTDGVFVQGIDISAANARMPSGLARGPSGLDPQEFSIYISDRGVDNGEDPNENDGKIYEMTLPPSGPDEIPPTVTAFDLPAAAASLTVPILTFTATDNIEVTGYLATETSTEPASVDPTWSASPPIEHTFAAEGNQVLYGWAKDEAGNVSAALSDTVVITLADTTPPVVTGFDLPDSYDSLTVPILVFTATDNTEVTGYLATETAGTPAADSPAWSAEAPIAHAFAAEGSHTLYGWAKDAAGNVSAALSDSVTITLADTTVPVVSAFDLPTTSSSLTVPILTFTATDDTGVTGYLATESATTPSAGAPGWTAAAPTWYTFASEGTKTLYGWARDAAGNVSASLSDTVVITLPDTVPPVVTDFDLPATSSSLTVPILTFTAMDDTGVTGYLATEGATVPAAGAPGWTAAAPTSHTFDSEGTKTLYGWAKDAAGNVSSALSDTVVISTGSGQQQVVEKRVAASSDDAEESRFGAMDLTSSDLELGTENGSPQTVGMRFASLAIPQGATIIEAYIQFTVDEADSGATSVVFRGQAVDNAATFTSTSGNITSRQQTSASVSWSPVAWSVVGLAGTDQRTPNLAPIIQEIVSRPGWVQGNSIVIMISGSGERTAESFEGQAQSAPLLHVVYQTGGSGDDTTPPIVTAFDLPAASDSLTVPIATFTATDDTGVTGYLATETSSEPAAGNPGWSASPPVEHTFASEGVQTLYGWAKDAAGNVSASISDTVTITLPDTDPPVVTAFDLPETYDSLTVPIQTFTATDDTGVTGYLTTETATTPAAEGPGWQATVPTEHTFAAEGSQTLYGWAKDAAGNVSVALSDTVVITLLDTTPPLVTAFDLPGSSNSLTVPILTFTATDDTDVTGYLATESATAPASDDPGWTSTAPASYTFSGEGAQTLYGWAKDAAGNISASLSDTVTITLPDAVPPVVTAFDLPETSDSLTVSILTFTATDDTGVTGYLATESATAPASGDLGWTSTAPTSYTFSGEGTQTLYGWAKDAAGNVSGSLSDTVVITLPDTVPPVVTGFDLPATSDSLTVPIVTFTATDDTGVTGYLATESATPPSAGDPGWSATAPTSYTFSSEGTKTLYGWAKDAAGNVSASLSDTVVITLGVMHVGDLDGSARLRGKSGKWEASVTVTVHDQNHNPVVGALVSGAWSGDTTGTVSGVTDGNGHVTLSTGNLDSGSTVTLSVAGVSFADFNYDAASNHDPDGDSDGTAITVIRP